MLSLFEVEVNISLLTNGGQSVTQYIVSWFTYGLKKPWLEGKHEVFWKWTSSTDQISCCAPLLLQVEVSGTEYPFLSSEQMQVSLLVKQLRVNFTKGERVTLRVFAVNSVGTSDPVSVQKTIPCQL